MNIKNTLLIFIAVFYTITIAHADPSRALERLQVSDASRLTYDIWGVSANGRVSKWNGNAWFEPNPAARLAQISVGLDGGVMGLTNDGRVWKWNGNAWFEPNSLARLTQISSFREIDAWGVGVEGRVFNTNNGGAGWGEVFFTKKIKQVSAGSFVNIWALTEDGHILKNDGFSWFEPNSAARATQLSACHIDCVWAIGANNRVFFTNDGYGWYEPNSAAKLAQISGANDLDAWGVASTGRVFQTTNRGESWSEPNPAARLKQISIGIE